MISIIVPVYNAEKYLKRCIDSVINQTYKDFELILVDDGSRDNSLKICDDYVACNGHIRVIHTENKGASSARNTGLDVANGTFIGFVDSDDWIEPDMYEYLMKNAEKYNADISCCNYYVQSDTNKVIECQEDESIVFSNNKCAESFLERKIFGNYIWNKVFKKSVIKENFRHDLSIGEDAYFLFRACLNSKRVVCCKEAKYHYCVRIGSATKMGFNPKVFQTLVYTDRIITDVKNEVAKSLDKAYEYGFAAYFSVLNVLIYHKIEGQYLLEYRNIVLFLNTAAKEGIKHKKNTLKIKLYALSLFNINKEIYRLFIRCYYKNKEVNFLND